MAHCRHKTENFGFSITVTAYIYGGFTMCQELFQTFYLSNHLLNPFGSPMSSVFHLYHAENNNSTSQNRWNTSRCRGSTLNINCYYAVHNLLFFAP